MVVWVGGADGENMDGVGAGVLRLTWGGVGVHGGLDDQRAALGGHGHGHLALLVFGQRSLHGLCVHVCQTEQDKHQR